VLRAQMRLVCAGAVPEAEIVGAHRRVYKGRFTASGYADAPQSSSKPMLTTKQ